MIIPSGAMPTGSDQFNPFFNVSATFTLNTPNVTTNTVLDTTDITNVQMGFGTGPDTTVTASGSGSSGGPGPLQGLSTPAPPSAFLFALGGLGFAAFAGWSRRRPHSQAA
jgi:hypothetical protein